MPWLTVASRRIGSLLPWHSSSSLTGPKEGGGGGGGSGGEMVGGKGSGKERRIETDLQAHLVIHHFS